MRHFFTPDRKRCNELAQQLFLEMSGVGQEGRKYEKMRRNADRMRETIEDRISLQSVYAWFDDITLQGNDATLGGVTFPARLSDRWILTMSRGLTYMRCQPETSDIRRSR